MTARVDELRMLMETGVCGEGGSARVEDGENRVAVKFVQDEQRHRR